MNPMSNKRFSAGIMSTCYIPWDENGRFAERIFRVNVQHALRRTRLQYVFGTAGEGYAVTDRQYEEIVSAFADEMRRGNAEPMVGIIDLSLGTIIERIQRARGLGVQQFQISLPSWLHSAKKSCADFSSISAVGFPTVGSCTTTCCAQSA